MSRPLEIDVIRAADSALGAVEKALAVLNVFDEDRCVVNLSELARRSGLPKSTAHRIVSILVAAGFVHRQGAYYEPGSRYAHLARLSVRHDVDALRRRLLPCLLDLYTGVREAVHLAVLDRGCVRVLERLHSSRQALLNACPESVLPAHACAAGKILLAFAGYTNDGELRPVTSQTITSRSELAAELACVRRYGLAFEQEELTAGVAAVAAPVFGPGRQIVAAITVAGPARRFKPDCVIQELRAAAHAATLTVAGFGWTAAYEELSPVDDAAC
ncbi:IclR family transcriptional regulator C-terminal domain-containing protein [Lentzea sp. NPDC051208]|uniref:IclR family transcriptional regulator n=1 Tax=Lentzea sp. NPDC051208 TaxID=3154642 RepID=UPI00341C69B7